MSDVSLNPGALVISTQRGSTDIQEKKSTPYSPFLISFKSPESFTSTSKFHEYGSSNASSVSVQVPLLLAHRT